jgi:hypothetical protein
MISQTTDWYILNSMHVKRLPFKVYFLEQKSFLIKRIIL